jgi:hypothetical protein
MIEPVAASAAAPASSGAGKSGDVSEGFEKLLVQQLAQEMMKTVSSWDDDSGDDGSSSDSLGGAYASMLPDALSNAVEQAGGLGLDLGLGKAGS